MRRQRERQKERDSDRERERDRERQKDMDEYARDKREGVKYLQLFFFAKIGIN